MTDHIMYVTFAFSDADMNDALVEGLEEEGTEVSDEVFGAVLDKIPQGVSFKVFFDDEDVEESFDILDEELM